MISLAIESLLAEEAAERKRELGRQAALNQHHPERVSQKVDTPTPPVSSPSALAAGVQRSQPNRAAEQAAVLIGTNRQYVSDAKRIKHQAPELLERVKEGRLVIKDAVALARAP